MADKFRADVKRYLDASDLRNAHTVALASCLFAREMEAVNVKPRTDGGTSDALVGSQPQKAGSFVYLGGKGLVEVSKAREGIARMVLNPKQPLDWGTIEGYGSVVASVLPPGDVERLKQIRAREGYWDKLIDGLLRQASKPSDH